ncbi:TPR-like protein [Schizopora paradoxa]|uniref:TPR-like protein n=1 Tax=Schizopora paradoxa TaxID=27342 RepID=A0A0H2S4D8_9AGAM|nr:TPR-like protein [Schizopora paradoxa]
MKFNYSDAGIAAVRLLEAFSASADFNPIVKSVAGGALHFASLIENYHSDKKAWAQFAEHVQKNVALVAQSIADQPVDATRLRKGLEELNKILDKMCSDISQKQSQGTAKRVIAFIKDPKKIVDMQKSFDRAVQLFHLGADIHVGRDLAQILGDIQKNTATLEAVIKEVQKSMHIASLTQLPYAHGATWNPDQMCLPNTRVSILDEIMQWLGDFDGNRDKKIFCLTGAPGAGKSAIAHSISKFCADKGWLSTAFFFNREDSTRAPLLFSTIVCDLAAKFPSFQVAISQAIESNPSLSAGGPSRIFDGLIVPFAATLPKDKPTVITIDALDEGLTADILGILVKGIINCPKHILLFVTSRETEEINQLVNTKLKDAIPVAWEHLKEVALVKGLKDWPGEEVVKMVADKSQGLMIWIVTLCQYLKHVLNPRKKLQDIFHSKALVYLGAEDKMDRLYATILLSLPWTDNDFSQCYGQLMGIVLASRVPMSVYAMKSLDPTMHAIDELKEFIHMLRPLLLSFDDGKPIQILHQSLHTFLVDRAHTNVEWNMHFSINIDMQNQRLALLCLQTIRDELYEGSPGTGYLDDHKKGIPAILDHDIPEHLKYACRFWIDHFVQIKNPSEEIIYALQSLLVNQFPLWVELTTCCGPMTDLSPLVMWIEETKLDMSKYLFSWKIVEVWRSISENLLFENRRNEALLAAQLGCRLIPDNLEDDYKLKNSHAESLLVLSRAQSCMEMRLESLLSAQQCTVLYQELSERDSETYKPNLSKSLHNLSQMLTSMGMREEALQADRDSVRMYAELADIDPISFNSELAGALDYLSVSYSDMGLREEALQASRDAVNMHKKLAEENPVSFDPDLARALRVLAVMLSEMGLREEALQTSRDAVGMYKELAEKNPASFNPDLAWALDNLGLNLSEVGLNEEALKTSKDAVEMYKELAEKDPVSYGPDLARALHNLAIRLSDSGLTNKSSEISREAIKMRRELAQSNPSAFNEYLADSLYNLSIELSEMGLKDDALDAAREAMEIRKCLASKHPGNIMFEEDLTSSLTRLSRLEAKEG